MSWKGLGEGGRTVDDVEQARGLDVDVRGADGAAVHGERSLGDAHVGQGGPLGQQAGGGDPSGGCL